MSSASQKNIGARFAGDRIICPECNALFAASRKGQRFCAAPAICRQRWNNRHGMTPGRIKGAVVKLIEGDPDVRRAIGRVK